MARISAEVHPQLLHIRLTRWNKPGLTQTQLAAYIVLSFGVNKDLGLTLEKRTEAAIKAI
ncbi:uncharacterized protein N7525_002104 [Penicillium rubens]|uniref:uncharacterized protein n=1 Tax=Penicillium rubens TaxID=1108849 RepID=UPI002A5AFB58|nr:uncharacterized protein N7525_002104 [Penicillium rubens]KAJ5844363.1 hypothetical protein N7525_002104 [Penicillium rubens]